MDELLFGLVCSAVPEVGSRVYPIACPSDTVFPYVTYAKLSTDPSPSVHSNSATERNTYQFTVWAKSFTAARDIATGIRIYLEGYESADRSIYIMYDGDKPSFDEVNTVFSHDINFIVKKRN